MRRTALPYLLCLLCLDALADARTVRQLHELDNHSRLLCASALLYFDPRERTPDPRPLTAVFHHLNTLEADVQQLGQPDELARPLRAMRTTFEALDGLPRDERERYPELIANLLKQRFQLGEAARRGLLQAGPAQLLGEQSRDLASLLLDYQLRHYPLPQKVVWLLPAERLAELDDAIEQRFDLLQGQYHQQAAALAKIRGNYRFVRRQLQQGGSEGNGGAEFYLSRAVLDLDELALAAEQGAP